MVDMYCPKITILTPSFNQADYIEENIRSVMAQDYASVEHIIIDGGSTDGTIDILKKYSHLTWVSEADGGQADALNKGLAKATGEIIGWLNSDDIYVKGIFPKVIAEFRSSSVHWVIGNLMRLYEATGSSVPCRSPIISRDALLDNPDILRQPPAFFRRSLLQQGGAWDAGFHMAMDYDLWVRLLRIVSPKMVDQQWAIFRIHKFQKTSRKNIRTQLNELIKIMRREGASGRQLMRLRLCRAILMTKLALKEALILSGMLSSKYEARPLRLPGPSITQ